MASPRHAAIADDLRAAIGAGRLAPGDALPSEAQLGTRYGVSRGTVRQALAALRAEGLVAGGRGKPPVVRRSGAAQSFDELVSFSAWARELGRAPGARTLELARRPASDEVAARLGLAAGAPVFELLRVRLLDGEPVMIERTAFTEAVGRLLADCDLDGGSIYEQLGERGITFAEADQTIEAVAAGADDASLLGVARRTPLLQVQRRSLDEEGSPLEWSTDRYRADAFAITVHHRASSRAALLDRRAA
jgi:GntR family transcriptional regulator